MKFPTDILKQCWFLAGPTAVGKTASALELATRIDAEILSLDSMAVFREMDIGTAKANAEEQAIVPHHLIDLVEPHENFSTAQYLEHALSICRDLIERRRVPLFAGGTGLYLRAVLRGVFPGPEADWDYRHELEEQTKKEDEGWLHAQLAKVDAVSAERLHPNDARRLIRALEIHRATGVPASAQQQEMPLPIAERTPHVYWLEPPREWLYDRINRRVELMFESGLVEETEALLRRDPPIARTARQALGYREVIDWLEGRISSEAEAKETIQVRTRQFAKRQHTWFRNLEECIAIPIDGTESPEKIAERVLLST